MSIHYSSFNKCQESELPELPPIASCHNSSDSNTISPQSIYGIPTSLGYSREEYRPEHNATIPKNKNTSVPGLKYILSQLDDRPSRSSALPPSFFYPNHVETEPVLQKPNKHNVYQKSKPMVGSKEWVHLRRENHKAVERKRRDCINDNINVLGELVPGPEKNKGGILSRVVAHINELREANAQLKQENDTQNNQFHATINELSLSLRKLEEENSYLKSRLAATQSSNSNKAT